MNRESEKETKNHFVRLSTASVVGDIFLSICVQLIRFTGLRIVYGHLIYYSNGRIYDTFVFK